MKNDAAARDRAKTRIAAARLELVWLQKNESLTQKEKAVLAKIADKLTAVRNDMDRVERNTLHDNPNDHLDRADAYYSRRLGF